MQGHNFAPAGRRSRDRNPLPVRQVTSKRDFCSGRGQGEGQPESSRATSHSEMRRALATARSAAERFPTGLATNSSFQPSSYSDGFRSYPRCGRGVGCEVRDRTADKRKRRPVLETIEIAVEFLLGSGIRVGELVTIRRADVNHEDGTIIIRGKGQRERQVCLLPTWRGFSAPASDPRQGRPCSSAAEASR